MNPPQFKIEKGVPITGSRGVKGSWKYPFANMQIGDSFVVPDCPRDRIDGAIYKARRVLGWSFAKRKEGTGYRVWRVEPRGKQ